METHHTRKEVTVIPILDIRTFGRSYQAVIRQTGKTAYLPQEETQIRPGAVVVPVWLAKKVLGDRFYE